jgi:putative redox protein
VSAGGESAHGRVVARRRSGYTHEVETDTGHTLVLDEPRDAGGADEGPSPTRALAASLAACTAITVEMYADRKGWELGSLEVEVEMGLDGPVPTSFDVTLRLASDLDDEQLERLRRIAARCPVHRALAQETRVTVAEGVERP